MPTLDRLQKKITCPMSALDPFYKHRGLTLIEVLIALAIIGIAMTAIIKATTQHIRATSYLQNKTMAMWVGQEVLNKARVKLLALPEAPEKLKEKSVFLGRNLYWQADQEDTPNKHIKKISVDVFDHENNDEDAPLASFVSYVYHEE